MKNIKLKILIMSSCLVLMQTQPVFCQVEVVNAINNLKTAVLDALRGSDASSVVSMLNKIFIIDTGGGSRQQSTLDKKVDMYVQQFYNFYTTDQNFISDKIKNSSATTSVSDLFDIATKVKSGVEKFTKQEIAYNTQTNPGAQYKDRAALLTVKAEIGNNNIDTDDIDQDLKGGNQYGSLYDPDVDKGKIAVDDTFKDILNVQTLLSPDSYTQDQAKVARLFINQLIQSAPPPKNFYIPAASEAVDIGNSQKGVYMYLPYAYVDKENPENNTPYTKVPVSINEKKCPTSEPLCDKRSDYEGMLDTLGKNSIYQQYKAKVRSKLAMRTLYLDYIFRTFQERYKTSDKDKSLVEKEKEMASVGLTQNYYNNLKNKSLADVNLETLYTLNKIVYFLHKLHQDNERTQLIASIIGIQAQPLDIQDEKDYLKPIGALIENSCWDLSLEKVPSGVPKGDQREAICKNPTQGQSSQSQGS
jgi:hypothetical protein